MQEEILQFLDFDRQFYAPVKDACTLLKDTLSDINDDEDFSKAIRFGSPELTKTIQSALTAIETEIQNQIEEMEGAEIERREDLIDRYKAFLEEKHGQLQKLQVERTAQIEIQKEKWAKVQQRKKKLSHLFVNGCSVQVDGRVVRGRNVWQSMKEWEDVTAIYYSDHNYYGLCADGHVYSTDQKCDRWENIIDICTSPLAGLRSDGTVVVADNDEKRRKIVSEWKNVIGLYSGKCIDWFKGCELLGLCADGTVLTTSESEDRQKELAQWKGVIEIVYGRFEEGITLGLCGNGKVVVVFDDVETDERSKRRVSSLKKALNDWTNVVSLSFNSNTRNGSWIFGVLGDGSVRRLKGDGYDWREETHNRFRDENHYSNVIDIVSLWTFDDYYRDRYWEYALHGDGTVTGTLQEYNSGTSIENWNNVAAIFKFEHYGVLALFSDGRIRGHGLVAEKKWSYETCKDEDVPTKFAKLLEEYGGRRLFGNVDTLEEDRIRIREQRDEERTRQCWREAGVCQRCGGIFKGLLFKKCINCGMSKDY